MTATATTTETGFGIDGENLAAWRAFLRAHSLMLRRLGRDLEEAGLPPLPWYDVLAALSEAEGRRLRQVELADRVTISVSGLSRLIDRIERDGLVRRTSCPSDRRSFFVELTDDGAAMLDRMWPVYARGVADDFLPALGSNPCEIRQALESIASTCDRARAEAAA
jgi:DNA-binding MarR family transcriptional regulator